MTKQFSDQPKDLQDDWLKRASNIVVRMQDHLRQLIAPDWADGIIEAHGAQLTESIAESLCATSLGL